MGVCLLSFLQGIWLMVFPLVLVSGMRLKNCAEDCLSGSRCCDTQRAVPRFSYGRAGLVGVFWVACFGLNICGGQEWSQFRGGVFQGKLTTGRPVEALEEGSLRWIRQIPAGHSSPVVSKGRIYVTSFSAEEKRVATHCFSLASGEPLWMASERVEKWPQVHPFNSQASPTCCADAEGVVSYFGAYGLIRYSNSGEKIWEVRLPIARVQYGVSTSPVVAGEKVYLVRDSREGSFLAAYSLRDGERLWRTERPLNSTNNSSPLLIEREGGRILVAVNGTPVSHVYDGQTGKAVFWNTGYPFEAISVPLFFENRVLFSNRGTGSPGDPLFIPPFDVLVKKFGDGAGKALLTDRIPPGEQLVLRPEVAEGEPGRTLAMVRLVKGFMDQDRDGRVTREEYDAMSDKMTSNRNKMASIQLNQKGQVEDGQLEWVGTRGVPEMSNPIEIGGVILTIEDGGICNLIDCRSGRQLSKKRIRSRGRYTASPVAWKDRVYLFSSAGDWTVLSIDGNRIVTLSRGGLGERVFATPALTEQGLVVRTEQSLRLYRD